MADRAIPRVTLNSGRVMPVIGLGTAGGKSLPEDRLVSVLVDAVEVGYRHFDTARLYGTERPLGLAIAESIRRGLIRSRDEVFVTSKLWCTDADGDLVLPALKRSLSNLGLDYLDLYLIHWPVRAKHGDLITIPIKEDLLPFDMRSTWEAMEECQRLGLVRSIGVSNFSCKKLSELLANAKIPPAVVQVEMNPAWDERKVRAFCKESGGGIHVTAYSPLGANGAPWGSLAVMGSPVLKEIAHTKGKTVAKVSLRWLYEQGVSVVVKSFNRERMEENLQIFDWELNEEERHKISQIPQRRGCSGDIFVSPNGQYKSVEELWDGEV